MTRLRSVAEAIGYRSLDFCVAGLLASSALSLYLRFPTRLYVLEGLARAIPMELGLFRRLLLGNYLLYGLVGDLFYQGLQRLGFTGHAYLALQAMDGVIGACGLAVFFFIARATGLNRWASSLWTAVLGLSLGYWLWSTEAENYILSTFLLQINFLFLLLHHKTHRITPWVLGVLQALAVFGHLVNGLFGVVALWIFIATDGDRWKSVFLEYAAACVGMLVVGFGTALAFVKPASWHEALAWILGSAAGAGGGIGWHGTWWSREGILAWLRMTARLFTHFSGPSYSHPPGFPFSGIFLKGALALLVLIGTLGILRWREAWRCQRVPLVACGLWLAVYAVIFTSWEPNTMVYRVSDLVPMILILALLGCTSFLGRATPWAVAALALCLGAGNFGTEVYPRSFWRNNPAWVFTQFLKGATDESSWIAGDNGAENIYIAYYAERHPLVLYTFRNRPERLRLFLQGLWKAHQKVYIVSSVLADPFWKQFFGAYRLEPSGQSQAMTTLFQVSERP